MINLESAGQLAQALADTIQKHFGSDIYDQITPEMGATAALALMRCAATIAVLCGVSREAHLNLTSMCYDELMVLHSQYSSKPNVKA